MSGGPQRRLSIGLTLTEILPPSIPVASAMPYGSVAIEQTAEFTAKEVEEDWRNGMRAIGKWCGVPNDLVIILERMHDVAIRLKETATVLTLGKKKQQLFQLLVKKRKAYPKSWKDEVDCTVKELMSLMSESVVMPSDESMVNPMNPKPVVATPANEIHETKTQDHQRYRSVRGKIRMKADMKNKKAFGQNKMDSRELDKR